MDFLFTQMNGPGFCPKSDLCSYLWDWDIIEDGTRSVPSLQPQHPSSPGPGVKHTSVRATSSPQGWELERPPSTLGPSSCWAILQLQACVCPDSIIPDLRGSSVNCA